MSLPVGHYLRGWSGRFKTAQEKALAPHKITEIANLLASLRELAPETLVDTINENKRVSFVAASSGLRIASITVDDEFA